MNPPHPTARRLVFVTGLSGAGMSTALKALEDIGYEAIDNLPLSLLAPLIQQSLTQHQSLAVGLDTRTWGFSPNEVLSHVDRVLALKDIELTLVFLECSDDILQRRFTETRRRHPAAQDRSVADGIIHERSLLAPLKTRADLVLDTSALSVHDLRRIMTAQFQFNQKDPLQLFVMSFAYRNGVPREADLVFDVRFLDNPHYDPILKPLTGLDDSVGQKIKADPDFDLFFQRLTSLLDPLLPRYRREGKSYLTIAIGCSGGRHRSVFVAEKLADWLRQSNYKAQTLHRELDPLVGKL